MMTWTSDSEGVSLGPRTTVAVLSLFAVGSLGSACATTAADVPDFPSIEPVEVLWSLSCDEYTDEILHGSLADVVAAIPSPADIQGAIKIAAMMDELAESVIEQPDDGTFLQYLPKAMSILNAASANERVRELFERRYRGESLLLGTVNLDCKLQDVLIALSGDVDQSLHDAAVRRISLFALSIQSGRALTPVSHSRPSLPVANPSAVTYSGTVPIESQHETGVNYGEEWDIRQSMHSDVWAASGLSKLSDEEARSLGVRIRSLMAELLVATQECEPAYKSRISGDFNGWDGDTIVRLHSGEVWQQTGSEYEYHYGHNLDVIVFSSRGTCYMLVQGIDEAVKVQALIDYRTVTSDRTWQPLARMERRFVFRLAAMQADFRAQWGLDESFEWELPAIVSRVMTPMELNESGLNRLTEVEQEVLDEWVFELLVLLSIERDWSHPSECRPTIDGTLDGTFTGWKGDTIVRLTNGQVWQQSGYSYGSAYEHRPEAFVFLLDGECVMWLEGIEDLMRVTRLR